MSLFTRLPKGGLMSDILGTLLIEAFDIISQARDSSLERQLVFPKTEGIFRSIPPTDSVFIRPSVPF